MNTAHYALRRTLPSWKFNELLAEMIEVLPRYKIDEVILIIDAEEFSHGFPTIELIGSYQKKLFRLKEALKSIGVSYSLNPWITQGHDSRGRKANDSYDGLTPLVHPYGKEEDAICCYLSDGWRSYMKETWMLFAETEPEVIWIEDDFRSFGTHACFCPLHLKRFSEQIRQDVSREQLAVAMLKPGIAHPWRREFLKMQGGIQVEIAAFLAEIVHTISPKIHLGLMSSGPRNHCIEGRQWNNVGKALSNGFGPIVSRPTMGNYWEFDLRGYYFSQDSVKITRHVLPEGTIDQTEVENVPFTRFSNSLNTTKLKTAISFAYGARGVTLNLYDHMGTPMEAYPEYGILLSEMKPWLNGLAEKSQRPGSFGGVRLVHEDSASMNRSLIAGSRFSTLRGEGEELMQAFEAAGIPTTYDDGDVTALTGQQPDLFTDKQLKEILGKGLFLDGPAAYTLAKRGFGEYIGLDNINSAFPLEDVGVVSAEEFFFEEWGGFPDNYLSALLPNVDYKAKICLFQPMKEAQTISRLVNPDRKEVSENMIRYENPLGGRVVVHGWEYLSSIGSAFYSLERSKQLQAAVRWLSTDKPSLIAKVDGAWPLALRKDCSEYSLLGIFNLSLDPFSQVEFELFSKSKINSVSILTASGEWKSAIEDVKISETGKGLYKIKINQSITRDTPLFCCVDFFGYK